MITWLIGENSFEVREALAALESSFDGTAEHIDADVLTLADLPDVLMGVSLFATHRLVVISNITGNAILWEKLPDWLPRINETIHVVFIDTKPDKRTASYKALKAAAEVREFPLWSERDTGKAEQWVEARAQDRGILLARPAIRHLVHRVGTDQWLLANAVDMAGFLDDATPEAIDAVIPKSLNENVFQLFETSLEGNYQKIIHQLDALEQQEDPYALFALLSSQAMSLAAIAHATVDDAPAKEFAIHPFVVSKMERHAKRLGKARVAAILEAYAQTDADLKRSKAAPWTLLRRVVLETAHNA